MINKRDIVKYYIAMFDRIPDQQSVNNWYSNAIENNWDEKQLVSSLLNAAVGVVNSDDGLKTLYPQYIDYKSDDASSVRKIIESVYKSLFDKDYQKDPSGIDHWVNQVIDKKIDISDAIVNIEHFTEDVYTNKINLNKFNYTKDEVQQLNQAVETFESRVEYANIVYPIVNSADTDKIKFMQDDINLIHSSKDFSNAYDLLITNIYNNTSDENIEIIKENLEHISNSSVDSISNEENLGFIDLPSYYQQTIHESMDLIQN